MFYFLASFPETETGQIERFRRKHDPTADLVEAHLAVVFPVPDSIGRSRLIEHCEQVLRRWQPFPVVVAGFSKSPDHWLLLGLREGGATVTKLYLELNTGILEDHARPDLFQPHIGLGQFLKPGAIHDWNHPDPEAFEADRYSQALREAEALDLRLSWVLDHLDLGELPDEVISWARGESPALAASLRVERTHTFRLRGTEL
jgi:2'-5' RNA ligase superfamily protein